MVEVNGREVNFKYSVGACIELARLCPEGDIANLMAYLNESEAGRRAENRMRFVCILSLMGEKKRRILRKIKKIRGNALAKPEKTGYSLTEFVPRGEHI